MVRHLRVECEKALHHVMSRGIERQDAVANDRDCEQWLELTIETYDWKLHTFVVMDNHLTSLKERSGPNYRPGYSLSTVITRAILINRIGDPNTFFTVGSRRNWWRMKDNSAS